MMAANWYSLSLSKDINDRIELETIKKEIKKVLKVIDFFYPVYFGKDEFKKFKKILFDNYLFFKIDEKDLKLIFNLEKNIYIDNIVSIFDLNHNRKPAQISQAEIDIMIRQLEQEKNNYDIDIGDYVEVITGMFDGLCGYIDDIKEDTVIIDIQLETKDIKIEVEKICLYKI